VLLAEGSAAADDADNDDNDRANKRNVPIRKIDAYI
jgi:hypothetical protein